ncbi:MAG: hypothetical protein ACLVI9_01840 [Anaerostipes hadrus]
MDCCATRLRITVTDETKVTDQYLKQSGSKGIIKKEQEFRLFMDHRYL